MLGAALQLVCDELDAVGWEQAAAWSRGWQGGDDPAAAHECLRLQHAIAVLCSVLYRFPPSVTTKAALLACIARAIYYLTGGTVREAFAVSRAASNAAWSRLRSSGALDALLLASTVAPHTTHMPGAVSVAGGAHGHHQVQDVSTLRLQGKGLGVLC